MRVSDEERREREGLYSCSSSGRYEGKGNEITKLLSLVNGSVCVIATPTPRCHETRKTTHKV